MGITENAGEPVVGERVVRWVSEGVREVWGGGHRDERKDSLGDTA